MVGIMAYGGYVPLYRLDRQELSRAWGRGTLKGEKAAASDEDSLTILGMIMSP